MGLALGLGIGIGMRVSIFLRLSGRSWGNVVYPIATHHDGMRAVYTCHTLMVSGDIAVLHPVAYLCSVFPLLTGAQ